jgi:hypothetical protein
VGWGIAYESADVVLDLIEREGKAVMPSVAFKKLTLWFKMVDDKGAVILCEIPATGAHKDERGNIAHALKGAMTNAMGNAASQMGWQESVYMGFRDHNNVRGCAPKATKKGEVATTPPADQSTAGETLPPFPPAAENAPVPPVAPPVQGTPSQPATAPVATAPAAERPPSTAEQIKGDIEEITRLCKVAGLKTRADHFNKIGEILGRPVKSWVDVTNADDRAKVIKVLADTKINTEPLKTKPSLGRTQKLASIFDLAGRFGCKTPEDACEEVSQIIGRTIKASADLTEPEVDKVLTELTELVAGLGL